MKYWTKKTKMIFLLIFTAIIIFLGAILWYTATPHGEASIVVAECDAEDQLIFGQSDAYKMGINNSEKVIFVNPQKAFSQLKKDYSMGIKAIRREFKLLFPLTLWTWERYGILSSHINGDVDEEIFVQALTIGSFFDVYENSFE